MGRLTPEGARRHLQNLFGSTLWIGLATAVGGDHPVEVTDDGYTRLPIAFSEPTRVDGHWSIASVEELRFGPWRERASVPVTHWFLADSSSGQGIILALGEIEPAVPDLDWSPPRPWTGGELFWLPGDLTITLEEA